MWPVAPKTWTQQSAIEQRGRRWPCHTIHDFLVGGLCSDGGSQVAGRRRVGFWIAAPGDRLWLAVSKSIGMMKKAYSRWNAISSSTRWWGAPPANRSSNCRYLRLLDVKEQ
jgi:hypothetical protein